MGSVFSLQLSPVRETQTSRPSQTIFLMLTITRALTKKLQMKLLDIREHCYDAK